MQKNPTKTDKTSSQPNGPLSVAGCCKLIASFPGSSPSTCMWFWLNMILVWSKVIYIYTCALGQVAANEANSSMRYLLLGLVAELPFWMQWWTADSSASLDPFEARDLEISVNSLYFWCKKMVQWWDTVVSTVRLFAFAYLLFSDPEASFLATDWSISWTLFSACVFLNLNRAISSSCQQMDIR